MIFPFFVIGIVVAALVGWWITRNSKAKDGISGSQAAFTLLLTILGFAWYFKERPDAERIETELKTEAVYVENDQVLIRTELIMHNAGLSQVKLEGRNARFTVRTVYPFRDLTPELERLLPDFDPGEDTSIRSMLSAGYLSDSFDPHTNNWDYSSNVFDAHPVDHVPLRFDLETGETEVQDHHRVIGCGLTGKILLIEAAVPKDSLFWEGRDRNRAWVTSQMVNLMDICRSEK